MLFLKSGLILFILAVLILIIKFIITQSLNLNFFINNQTIVIVRSVGERTETKNLERLEKIFGKNNVYLIKNVTPLADASKKTFELALSKAKWILVADSDVFFFEDKIWIFIEKAHNLIKKDKNAFCFQGKLFDKFSLQARMTGFYLYYLPNLKYKEEYYNACKDKIRPEACIRDNIEKQGFNSYESENLVGIHDYFQDYKDITKKAILHSEKNDFEIKDWVKNWQQLALHDEDFKYALLGYKIYKSINNNSNNNPNTNNTISKNTKGQLIPDSKKFDEFIKNYNIPTKNKEITDEEINEILEKCNTQSIKEAKDIQFIKKIKPVIEPY